MGESSWVLRGSISKNSGSGEDTPRKKKEEEGGGEYKGRPISKRRRESPMSTLKKDY